MSKELVAYFSASDNKVTKNVAKHLSNELNADVFEIKPKVEYTKEDLNWNNKTSRTSLEMENKEFRPEIISEDIDISVYDTIYLGFPIWWYRAPTLINTFLEKHDFSNKTIIIFASSGGSNFGKTLEYLKGSAKNATFKEGKVFRGHNIDKDIKDFIKTMH